MKRSNIKQLISHVFVIAALCFTSAASAQTFEWVRQYGTVGDDGGDGMTVDSQQNIFVIGETDSQGSLSKFDSDGQMLWMRPLDDSNAGWIGGVSADSFGNAYATGRVLNSVDSFLSKYSPDGQLIWKDQFGADPAVASTSVSSDDMEHTVVAGTTWGDLVGPVGGTYDAFLRKYDSEGNVQWTRQFGTDNLDGAEDVFADSAGNYYVAGFTWGNLDGLNAGAGDAFVRKYNAGGNILSTRQFGTTGIDIAFGVHADPQGNVYLAGFLNADPDPNDGIEFEPDAFVRAYDADGDLLWARQQGTASGSDRAWAVATDRFGNVYIGGDNDDGVGTEADIFVSQYSANGDLQWTLLPGTDEGDGLLDLVADELGNVYFTGSTRGDLGGPNGGLTDAYLAKIRTIPEPTTMVLSLLCVAGAVGSRRRSRH